MRYLLVLVQQAVGEDIIANRLTQIDSSALNGAPSDQPKTFMISLATLLIVNVVIMVGNFAFDLIKHRKDNHNHKVHIIAHKGVEVEAFIYARLQAMASLQPGDEHKLLDEIISLDSYFNTNRLYIEKKYLAYATEFLDYFKKIQHKMTQKDIKKEESFFVKLSKAFYGV